MIIKRKQKPRLDSTKIAYCNNNYSIQKKYFYDHCFLGFRDSYTFYFTFFNRINVTPTSKYFKPIFKYLFSRYKSS